MKYQKVFVCLTFFNFSECFDSRKCNETSFKRNNKPKFENLYQLYFKMLRSMENILNKDLILYEKLEKMFIAVKYKGKTDSKKWFDLNVSLDTENSIIDTKLKFFIINKINTFDQNKFKTYNKKYYIEKYVNDFIIIKDKNNQVKLKIFGIDLVKNFLEDFFQNKGNYLKFKNISDDDSFDLCIKFVENVVNFFELFEKMIDIVNFNIIFEDSNFMDQVEKARLIEEEINSFINKLDLETINLNNLSDWFKVISNIKFCNILFSKLFVVSNYGNEYFKIDNLNQCIQFNMINNLFYIMNFNLLLYNNFKVITRSIDEYYSILLNE